jgi:hypothetical protein
MAVGCEHASPLDLSESASTLGLDDAGGVLDLVQTVRECVIA